MLSDPAAGLITAFRPGDRCKGYEIVRLIAQGGMGEVYEAVHEFTRRPVALKCMQLKHADRTDMLDRMRAEARALCELHHPNIVNVYDAGVSETGIIFIAMELLEGKTLRELIRLAPGLPATAALYYGFEVADAIDAAHEMRIFHRDLKPENVFITKGAKVKVLDLGAAKFHGYGLKTTENMRTMGTTAYMSPEHLQGQPVDGRTDIYALGLILYELIAGRHPFADPDGQFVSPVEMAGRQVFGKIVPLPEVSPDIPIYIWQAIEPAMQKDREERYPTMAEFARALRAARKRYVEEGADDSISSDGPALPQEPGARRDYTPPRPLVTQYSDAPVEQARVIAPGALPASQPAPAAFATTMIMGQPSPPSAISERSGKTSEPPREGSRPEVPRSPRHSDRPRASIPSQHPATKTSSHNPSSSQPSSLRVLPAVGIGVLVGGALGLFHITYGQGAPPPVPVEEPRVIELPILLPANPAPAASVRGEGPPEQASSSQAASSASAPAGTIRPTPVKRSVVPAAGVASKTAPARPAVKTGGATPSTATTVSPPPPPPRPTSKLPPGLPPLGL